jgi:hypothetical protein
MLQFTVVPLSLYLLVETLNAHAPTAFSKAATSFSQSVSKTAQHFINLESSGRGTCGRNDSPLAL